MHFFLYHCITPSVYLDTSIYNIQGSLYRWIILCAFTNLSYISYSKQCKYFKYFIQNANCLFFSFRNIQNVTHFSFPFWKGILSCPQRKRQWYWNFHKESLSLECSCRHLCWRDVNTSSILHEIYSRCSGFCCLRLAKLQFPTFPSPPRNPTAEIRKPGLNIWIFKKKKKSRRNRFFLLYATQEGGKWLGFALGPLEINFF